MRLARLSTTLVLACFAAHAQTNGTVKLRGNRHPLARTEFDRGPVAPDQAMERMVLVLARSAEQQAELDAFVASQQDPASPEYQHWLTPEEFGRRFGSSDADMVRVSDWLAAQGFRIDEVAAGRGSIVFSGTAGQVRSAFLTEIHRFSVNGELHVANAGDPEVPQTLAGAIAGIASLNDFHSQPALASFAAASFAEAASPDFTSGSSHYLAPADFAAIYDAAPLYISGVDGSGTSIAVVGRSNFRLTDVQTFRSQMGLTANSPTIILNGPNPGILPGGEQAEATLDIELSGAIARRSAVKFVLSASTAASDGVMLSAQYAVNHNVAPVITTSFSMCEAAAGAAYAKFWNNLWQQAAAEGITSLVASGDSGAAGCDPPSATTATNGPGVNVICSTPYSMCVGGTQLNDTATPALYWSASNGAGYESALSYIPEIVWNTSGTVTGGSDLWASGGGTSSVFLRPSWQTGNGVPSDSWRHVPDVSASSSSHDGYLMYMNNGFYSVAGTSTATPAWAGLMALVNQQNGGSQGNANPTLYGLARLQASGGAPVFHDIVTGNNSVPGVTGFSAGPGYDQATGLGSPDALQLVQHWKDANVPSMYAAVANTSPVVTQGSGTSTTATVSVSKGFSSPVSLSIVGLPTGVNAVWYPATLAAPGSGASTLNLSAGTLVAPGTYNVQISARGGGVMQVIQATVTVMRRP